MNIGVEIGSVIFWALAALAVTSGALVVANPVSRNPVTSAMFLVLSMGAISGLFVLLGAFFLAAVQLLVYAGAVMVLFLFVLMAWGKDEPERAKRRKFALVVGGTSVLVLLVVLALGLAGFDKAPSAEFIEGGGRAIGSLLVKRYVLAFELVGLIIMAAAVGVMFIGKRSNSETQRNGS
ncbi:MAG: NADH-quinone oxidoreductase subunit J [Verrucomicrobiae bacterium]|nr:NADH-quinone oxidoreductase subunit J [Verrucomicrobiae bacterium]